MAVLSTDVRGMAICAVLLVYPLVSLMSSAIEKANEIISSVRIKTNRAILFFSAGKDSIALLDLMHPHFDEIICVFMYFVKDLEHVENYLQWAKAKYPKIKIIQVPHWNLTYILKSGMFCTPHPNIKLMKLADIDNSIKIQTGIKYSFLGMKKADSLNRRLMLNTFENGESNGKVYPLQDWTNKDVLSYMKIKKLPQPIRYSAKASGGVGFNLDCFLFLREKYPDDLKKILKAFPMSEKILWDYDNK